MPDEHVVDAEAQVAQDLDPLERVDLRVEVLDLDAHLVQVVGQVLGHLLGQRRDDDPLAPLDAAADVLDEVVDLALGRPDADRRVDDAGRPDELLDDLLGALELVRAGRGAHEDDLVEVASNSSNVSGRLSSADGRRKPKSTRISLRVRSFLYMPTTWGMVMWLSSTTSSQSGGK